MDVVRLAAKGRQRAIGFDLMSIGEIQFSRNVLERIVTQFPEHQIWMFHHDETATAFNAQCPHLANRLLHAPYRWLVRRCFCRLDLYITAEQIVPGPPGVYTLTLFHGQPSKGVTFDLHGLNPLALNDAFFLYGPLQRQALDEHLALSAQSLPPHLSLFNIGYTKSDELVAGGFNRATILRSYGCDLMKPTVLYAPAFNEGASLRECGEKIIRTLCENREYNILAKLAVDCLRPTSDLAATGGVDWFDIIGALERDNANFKLVRTPEADEALAAADVLVTCVSSISFEFLALGKPVVFIETPRFFRSTLKDFFPRRDVSSWEERTVVNAGREFGLIVASPTELPSAIQKVLARPGDFPRRRATLREYLLYNPGRATDAAVAKIAELLACRVRSQRPGDQGYSVLRQMAGLPPQRAGVRPRLRQLILQQTRQVVKDAFARRGYSITRTGLDFIDATTTVAAARDRRISVCDYIESQEDHSQKRGRRDRIIEEMEKTGALRNAASICEIGAGTGRYLEKIVAIARPHSYEVYETDRGWVDYLEAEYGGRREFTLRCHPADGATLRFTPNNSCDLVHAHAVFVYLPLLKTMEYLRECVRVCRPNGYLVFDFCLDTTFTWPVVNAWLAGPHRFPTVIAASLLGEFARAHCLRQEHAFPMIYGESTVDYILWRKGPPL